MTNMKRIVYFRGDLVSGFFSHSTYFDYLRQEITNINLYIIRKYYLFDVVFLLFVVVFVVVVLLLFFV